MNTFLYKIFSFGKDEALPSSSKLTSPKKISDEKITDKMLSDKKLSDS